MFFALIGVPATSKLFLSKKRALPQTASRPCFSKNKSKGDFIASMTFRLPVKESSQDLDRREDLRKNLAGTQPLLIQVPPKDAFLSSIKTVRSPAFKASFAQVIPAAPAPIIATSYIL